MTRMNYGPRFCNGSGGHFRSYGRRKSSGQEIETPELTIAERIHEQAQLVRDLRDEGEQQEMLNAIKELNKLHFNNN